MDSDLSHHHHRCQHPSKTVVSVRVCPQVRSPNSADYRQAHPSSENNQDRRISHSPPQAHFVSDDGKSPTNSSFTLFSEGRDIERMSLPPKQHNQVLRNLRWTILSVYRRLNILTLILNLIPIVVLTTRHRSLLLQPNTSIIAVSSNLTLAVLMRQDLVVNGLFWLFGKVPRSLPLRLRCLAAKIYHLGGIHSGAAIAAILWFFLFTAAIILKYRKDKDFAHGPAIITLIALLNVLLISIIIFSHPRLRVAHHNLFESIHRFAGWAVVALFWSLYALLVDGRRKNNENVQKMASALLKDPVTYLLAIVTVSLIAPWLKLRRVAVHAEPLSDRAVLLHFTHTTIPICSAPRISEHPLRDWHAFAGIRRENGDGFSLMVANAGDWTAKMVKSPPTSLWVRGMPARGVLHTAMIFKRVILAATGSGIGPILSLLRAPNLQCRILWSTPDPLQTYQQPVIDKVLATDPEAVIINTSNSKRPDLSLEAYRLYTEFEAEAVFIISNQQVTRKFVYALESRGVPTFAPIFDS